MVEGSLRRLGIVRLNSEILVLVEDANNVISKFRVKDEVLDLEKKYQTIASTETMYEDYHAEDASLVLVAFGYMARCCKEAVGMARSEGLRVGLLRPITLWPFPYKAIKELANRGGDFLVVEDNMGQMINDVRLAVEGQAKVHLLNASARDIPTDAGIIFPQRVLEEIKKLI